MDSLPTEPADLTPAWLTEALAPRTRGARVLDVSVSRIDARGSLFGQPLRLGLTWDRAGAGPRRLFAKLTGRDAAARAAAAQLGVFRREVAFYQELAETCGVRAPALWFAAATDDMVVLLLEDLTELRHVDAGTLSRDDVGTVIDALAMMHARWWQSPALGSRSWLARDDDHLDVMAERLRDVLPRFHELFDDQLEPEQRAFAEHLAREGPQAWAPSDTDAVTLVHGDPKPSNIFFGDDGPVFVDWQAAGAAHATTDLANLFGAALSSRVHDDGLVERYCRRMAIAGVEVNESELAGSLRLAARAFVVRAVAASVSADERFLEGLGPVVRRRISYAISLG